ncbi:MAG: zinc-binding dehydrogenase [Elusimicrobia bacterium]|nr:zinc-binding dehydrogenase [Elusimicrobiota bacterium]
MKAAVLRELNKPLVIEEVGLPKLAQGQVLVQMQMAGVCGTQKIEVYGGRGPDKYLPHLVGHEGVGIVMDVGPSTTKVAIGDQVALTWIRPRGAVCESIRYSSAKGTVNAGPIATFCETPVVCQHCVIRINPAVKPEIAVLAGCALPTGMGAVKKAMPANPQGAVCILGLGGVGLAAVCGAKICGWPLIAAADLWETRTDRAVKLGATHVVNAAKEDIFAMSQKITKNKGFDLVVECAGSERAMETAVGLAKPQGGKVIYVGNLEAGRKIQIDPFCLIEGRWLGGSWGGNIDPEADISSYWAGIFS